MFGYKYVVFAATFTTFGLYFYWIQLDYLQVDALGKVINVSESEEDLAKNYQKNERQKLRNTTELRYILFWSKLDLAPFTFFKEGQTTFLKKNCSVSNCYITTNRTFFDSLTKFDAVAFNGRSMSRKDLPKQRSPHQKYIYFNMESSVNVPACDKEFDDFFNWTATYRLNSDIPFPYILIRNEKGDIIGPKDKMQWPKTFPEADKQLSVGLWNKTKAAAWFVSHCGSRSGRDEFIKQLQKALKPYKRTVDVYGKCGTFNCPRNETKRCNNELERDYFFYMSLENSFEEDYVTEKLLTALQHKVVPIVYGGADYSRFLPPGSYINARQYNATQLAAVMEELMNVPEKYDDFFKWKSLYTYSDPALTENVCAVCAALNNEEKFYTKTVYNKFRKWWNPNYEKRCRKR